MPESIIQALCKISVLVHSNVVPQLHLLPILFLHLWEHNIIAAHKVLDHVRQPHRHPRKRTVNTLSLLFQVQNKEYPWSSMTWNEFNLCSSYKTVHCIFITNHIKQVYFQYLHIYRTAKIQFLIQKVFKLNY